MTTTTEKRAEIQSQSWINKLYEPVLESMLFIDMLKDVEHPEGRKDERTPLEIELYQRLEPVLELLSRHPQFKDAPAPEATLFQQVPINYSNVRALSTIEEGAERAAYRELLQACLADFLNRFKIRKIKFAEVYGCNPNYLSRMLGGEKNVNYNSLSVAVKQFGIELKLDRYGRTWEFVPVSPLGH